MNGLDCLLYVEIYAYAGKQQLKIDDVWTLYRIVELK